MYYQDGSGENYQAKFPSRTNDWNRSAVQIPAKKTIKRVEIYLLFRNNNKGKVWFEDVPNSFLESKLSTSICDKHKQSGVVTGFLVSKSGIK
nr:hypothetical protein [Bacillus toyonensis]